MNVRRAMFGASFLLSCFLAASLHAAPAPINFNRHIRPILAEHCFACHGPDARKRKGGAKGSGGLRLDTSAGARADLGGHVAIVPGHPDSSRLVTRLFAAADEIMPPPEHHKPLSDAQKKRLVQWIRSGAIYTRQWAFVPPKRVSPPNIGKKHRVFAVNWIDTHIIKRLEDEGAAPSLEADRRTLIRRVSFDIIGLPPSPHDVAVFVADRSSNAFAKVVDRLLASPHFGERMASQWLDLVRYADTNGYHADLTWTVWPYRDYVIRAFNANMPFDQFTIEQVAGDLLPDATIAQRVAAGFNRLNMKSTEFGIQDKEYRARYAADRVRTTSGVWLGATLGCAECHDHKFDPYKTRDFYRFAAFFADIKQKGYYPGAQRSGWGESLNVITPEMQKRIDDFTAQRKTVAEKLAAALSATPNTDGNAAGKSVWAILAPVSAVAESQSPLKIMPDKSVLASGKTSATNGYTVQCRTALTGITGFRLEALPHRSLPRGGPGRSGNGNFVVTEFRVAAQSVKQGAGKKAVKLTHASASFEQTQFGQHTPYKVWNAASAIDNDVKGVRPGWAILPQVNKAHHAVFETVKPVGAAGETVLTFTIEQKHGGHEIGRFRLAATRSKRPLRADVPAPKNLAAIVAKPASRRSGAEKKSLAAACTKPRERKALYDKLMQLERNVDAAKKAVPTMLATVSVKPAVTRVLPRGNWMDSSGDVVQPGVPAFMRQVTGKPAPGEMRATRLDLAKWLIAKDNPLTARVFVNRQWKMLFGTGLSRVLDDFGAQGEAPSHPELLDQLALAFMDSGWNVKKLIRLMVLSRTYRQSSLPRAALAVRDPGNRLLARQARFRLEAEMIRDNALAASDLLVRRIGGPSVMPYQPKGYWAHLNFPRRTYKHDVGDNQYRRAVYTHWQRQFLHPALMIFDAPSREACTASRPISNTPLGALALLNDPSQVEAARVLAERVLLANTPGKGSAKVRARLQRLAGRVLSREFNAAELQILQALLLKHTRHFSGDADAARALLSTGLRPVSTALPTAELAAWTSVARAVLNMHETITRN